MKKFLILIYLSSGLWAISNYEVSKKSDDVMTGFEDSKLDMEMILINAFGQKSSRKMTMMILEKDGGDKSLMEFNSPADVKGTKFLSYSHIQKDDDQWLFLPGIKRIKRISSKNQSGSFMGSEFSYEDLASFNVDKYTYSGEAKIVNLNGHKMFMGERAPISKNSGYTKQVSWIDTTSFLIHKVDYYDRKHELIKTSIFEEYKKISGIWRVGKMTMINHQNKKKTILLCSNEHIRNGLKEISFHKKMLK